MSGVAGEIDCPQCGGKAFSDMETYDYSMVGCEECGYTNAFFFRCGGNTLAKIMKRYGHWVKTGRVTIEEDNSGFLVQGYTSDDHIKNEPSVLSVEVCKKCCNSAFLTRVSGHYVRCEAIGRMTIEHCDVVPDDCPFRLEHIVSKANAKQESL